MMGSFYPKIALFKMSLQIRFICEQAEGESDKELTVEAQAGERLTQAAYRAGVNIQQTCGGSPSCTDCRVIVREGGAEAFETIEHAEKTLLGNVFFITKERLACQAIIKSSSTIWVPCAKKVQRTTRR
jgi:ferredoxin